MKKLITGFLASIGLLTLIVVGVLAWNLYHFSQLLNDESGKSVTVEPNSVLKIEIGSKAMDDGPSKRSFVLDMIAPKPLSLFETLAAINHACTDDRIKGAFIDIQGTNLSLSQAQELRAVFKKMRSQGKFVYAYSHSFGEGSNGTSVYYLASVADKILLQPQGMVAITGFSLENLFFKELFENWDVTPQFDQRESYKGLFEMFTKDKFSDETRSNLQNLINDLTAQVMADIGEGRVMAPQEVKAHLDNAPYVDSQALARRLVDQLLYDDEVTAMIEEQLKTKPTYVSLKNYHEQAAEEKGKNAIAVIFVEGGINALHSQDSSPLDAAITPQDIVKFIKAALIDDNVKAIVLRVNSPGGVASSAEAIWRVASQAKAKNKPLIVSMGTYAASAGYMIAAPATTIVATPATITGSIGVASGKFALDRTLAKVGISTDKILGSKNADFWSMTTKFTPDHWQIMQTSLDSIYASFMDKVVVGRGMTKEDVRKVAQGQVWTGKQAKENGLVDELGGLLDALGIAKNKAAIAEQTAVTIKVMNTQSFKLKASDLLGANAKTVLGLTAVMDSLKGPQQRYSLAEIK